MSEFKVTLQGQTELLAKLNKMSNAALFLDPIVLSVSNTAIRNLVKGSQGKGRIKTGNTARNWRREKLGFAKYALVNDAMTLDKKHLIVNILNYGHGEIKPVKAKMLRIPLTEKGVNRGAGYKSGAEVGVDYIFAKRASPTAGTKFIEDEQERAQTELVDKVMQKIKGMF